MPIALYRIDDRLVHGQVVVGWGCPLQASFIVLVDDQVATTEWEQELYRMGVPQGTDVFFASVASAAAQHAEWVSEPRIGIVLTPDIATMRRLVAAAPEINRVNIGGLHHRAGRVQKLRYVFLTPEEENDLRALAASGIEVTAQDVPHAHEVPLDELLAAGQAA